MNDSEIKPTDEPSAQPSGPPPLPRAIPKWRWGVHLALLTSYPLLMGLAAYAGRGLEQGPILRNDIPYLVINLSAQLVFFGMLFGLAWLASRARADQLYMRPEPWWRALGFGFLFSIGLRGLVAIAALMALGVLAALSGDLGSQVERLRPQSEALIDTEALVHSPLYLLVNVTFVSFIVAGLREELWRAGMLAGWFGLLPVLTQCWKGRMLAVALTSVCFGLGHFSQGWGGVVLTTILGLGLGIILVWRRSFWEAVLAHGFFDATTFVLMYFLARYWPQLLPGAKAAANL
jgi:hypothetical protein